MCKHFKTYKFGLIKRKTLWENHVKYKIKVHESSTAISKLFLFDDKVQQL